jgi:putative oxidoreductase
MTKRIALAQWAPIPLRLIVGFGFMQHGFAKMSRGPDAFAAILHALGVPAPHLMAWVTILTELLGGLAVLVGAVVPLASVPMAVLLLVAIFTVHLPNGFSSVKLIAVNAAGAQFGPVGYEVNLLYLACLAGLVLGGAGPFALDTLLINSNLKKGEPMMAKQIAILVMAIGMSMALAKSVDAIAFPQTQDQKMQSSDKMKNNKMGDHKMAGDHMKSHDKMAMQNEKGKKEPMKHGKMSHEGHMDHPQQ